MKNKYIIVVILLIIIGLVVFWYLNKKNQSPTGNSSISTPQVTAPKDTSQTQDCEDIGGTVEKKDKDMGDWTELDKWRCACGENETFSGNLECNKWFEPEM